MFRYLAVVFSLIIYSDAVIAQAKPSQLEFRQIDKGVFDLEIDQVADLTDKSLLIALVRGKRNALSVRIGGRTDNISIGQRYNLKKANAPFYLDDMFADKRECFLDVLAISDPAGGKANATFRLKCE